MGAVCVSAICCGSAYAQDETPFDLGQIVLRGDLQNKTLEDTQSSVAVETGEELERRGDQDIYDVIERTPGVTATFGEKGFAIRGIDQRATGGSALAVTTQVDGVALPTNQSTFFGPYSAWDIQQIEVYRGPQSTQQGRNALAGAVVIRTNDPEFEDEYKLRGEIGSRDYYRFAFMANTVLVEDTLALRIAGVTQSEDGFVDAPNLGVDDFDGRDLDDIRVKLRWNPNDQFEAIVSYAYTENFGGEDFVSAADFPGQRINNSNVESFEGTKHRNFGLRLKYEFDNGAILENELNVYSYDYERQEDFDFSAADLGFLTATGFSDVIENDLRYRFDTGMVSGVVGLFYTDIDFDRPSFLSTDSGFALGGVPNGVFVTRTDNFATKIENYAVYGEAEVDAASLAPGLSFTFGLRYDVEDFSFVQAQSFNPMLLPNSGSTGNTRFEAFLPKVGVTYAFNPMQSLGFTYQRGYRAGSALVNSATGLLNEVDPEFTDNFELSYRGSFFADQMRVTANVFYTEWTDQQVFVNGPNFATNRLDRNLENAGESRLWGGELTVEGEASDDLFLYGSVALANTEFTDFVSDAGVNLAGNEFPGASRVTASIGFNYRINDAWSVGADMSFTEGSFFDVQNDPGRKSDDRVLVNAQLNYERDNLKVGLFVRNLFDKDYITSRDFTVVRAGEPLTVGAFVERTF